MQPRARRPRFPASYDIAQDEGGLLDWAEAEAKLASSRNYWLATAGAGGPSAAPVWGVWLDGTLCFGSDPDSRKVRNLVADPRVAVHLESGDDVVIVVGRAEPLDVGAYERVVDAYERKYDLRPEPGEGWFAIRPMHALAWLERDYRATATRYDW